MTDAHYYYINGVKESRRPVQCTREGPKRSKMALTGLAPEGSWKTVSVSKIVADLLVRDAK